MRKYLFLIAAMLISTSVFAQSTSWNFDKAHSSIGFDINHMVVSEVSGQFNAFDGSVISDKNDFSDAKIMFKIDAASINTDNEKRDGHLKSPDFFDVAKYPDIRFEGTSFKKLDEKNYTLTGNLTMHGVTKAVELTVKYGGTINDPYGNTRAGFKITGALNRTDFGLTWNSIMEAGGLIVGEEVRITGRFELLKSK